MTTATDTPIFKWDNDYNNTEQVRPYLDTFNELHDHLKRRDGLAYNASFKGLIPGLAESPNEDTGIYLLQTLRELDILEKRKQKAKDEGAYLLTERQPKENERGTLIRFGWYMGGTGWGETQNVKIQAGDDIGVLFKEPRQRRWRTYHLPIENYLFKPNR